MPAASTKEPPKPEKRYSSADQTTLSRNLSKILRHKAHHYSLPIRDDGFIPVNNLLTLPVLVKLGITKQRVLDLVAADAKKRYSLITIPSSSPTITQQTDPRTVETGEDGDVELLIRANQGHSIPVPDLSLSNILDPADLPTLIHGTSITAWPQIQSSGRLSKMKRNHIHLTTGLPSDTTVLSGFRKSSRVLIYLDAARCMASGIQFHRSENGVILSDGVEGDGFIPIHFFSRVVVDGVDIAVPEPLDATSSELSKLSLSHHNHDAKGVLPEPREKTEAAVSKDLFGGAIKTLIPASFIDASEMRQVPDSQEVYLSPHHDNTNLIIEILESLDPINSSDASAAIEIVKCGDDDGAQRDERVVSIARAHWAALASDNEADESTITSIRQIHSSSDSSCPSNSSNSRDAKKDDVRKSEKGDENEKEDENEDESHEITRILAHGTQKIKKFGRAHETSESVGISLAIIRLSRVDADILVIHSATEEEEIQFGRNRVYDASVNLRIVDWSLFP